MSDRAYWLMMSMIMMAASISTADKRSRNVLLFFQVMFAAFIAFGVRMP
mgnify:CR=1 FL=1